MKVLGLITEYNPFHFGHKHHLELSKKDLKATHTIAIMSGSFVQRGEPSLVDKWTKTKMAIDSGVDLVIELPFVYASQSAELFALGAMKILDSLNIVDYISFGSEIGEIDILEKIASILVEEPKIFKEILKSNLDQGLSFSVSRSKAMAEFFKNYHSDDRTSIEEILKSSNNILGIEYLKAIKTLKSKITPHTISRLGHGYNDVSISEKFASATGIRNLIIENGITNIKNLVPKTTYEQLLYYHRKYHNFNHLERYKNIIDYLLLTKSKEDLKKIQDMEEGLENRILKASQHSKTVSDLVQNVSTKRYPKTRIQRILIHLLMNLNSYDIKSIYKRPNEYIRILGSNKNGLELLRKIKDNSDVQIISKFAQTKYINNETINLILNYEKKSTDLFYFGIGSKELNNDYLISPYIK